MSGLSARALARKAAISHGTIPALKKRARKATAKGVALKLEAKETGKAGTLHKIAAAVPCSFDWLAFGKGEPMATEPPPPPLDKLAAIVWANPERWDDATLQAARTAPGWYEGRAEATAEKLAKDLDEIQRAIREGARE